MYEALLAQSGSQERIEGMRRRIEQVGGAVQIEQTGKAILVTLSLPAPYTPEQFYPEMPFFPV